MQHWRNRRQQQRKNHRVRKTSKLFHRRELPLLATAFISEGGESVTPTTLTSQPTSMSPTKPYFTSTPESSPSKTGNDSLIAYVHLLSPSKRNKKNTMDYSTLLLQTSDNPSQKAPLYSKNKRPLLLESKKKAICP